MKSIKLILTLLICLFLTNSSMAQSKKQCALCKMDIKHESFIAKAINTSDRTFHFDAIECLVNYVKSKSESSFQELLVTDYDSGQFVVASKAYYLKSDGIRSPMGANLSAFTTSASALKYQKEKGGEIFRWQELQRRFISSDFGSTEHSHHHNRPDAYAPNGIMGDHLHPKGGIMFSVRSMCMKMDGNREGSDRITDETIYERFMVAPQNMTMQMYMIGMMYAPSDKLTLMLMQNFAKKDMDLTARMMMDGGMTMLRDFSTSSRGLGDLKFGALYGLYSGKKVSFHTNLVLNIPVGDIQERGVTPMMADAKLPYAMQLGTGTVDVTLGGTLKGMSENFSWGIQQLNTIRTGKNKEDYRFGNLYELHSWLGYSFSNIVSVSARVSGSSEDEIDGADSELNPMMVTTADTSNYGGRLIRSALGVNLLLFKSKFIVGAEIGTPLYQNYNGLKMNEGLSMNLGLKYTVR